MKLCVTVQAKIPELIVTVNSFFSHKYLRICEKGRAVDHSYQSKPNLATSISTTMGNTSDADFENKTTPTTA